MQTARVSWHVPLKFDQALLRREIWAYPQYGWDFPRRLGNGFRKNGVRNRCPYRQCGVDTEIPYRLRFRREFCLVLPVRVASGVDTEFPYRVRIVDRGVDCRDSVCRHHFRFPDKFRKKFRKYLERPRKRSQSVSWNSPSTAGIPQAL